MTTLEAIKALGVNTNFLTRHASLAEAELKAATRTGPIHRVVLGCDGRFWVVTAREAGKLVKAGYEIAV